eukprot:TRINITY_DN1282_c0_g1_i1.p1 TRINITY_DN1282_c0_g1~~TRINITY_DN1282_c0_g1_i1.p1  ORF type:complete len:142 (+),score=6.01 TRINITY_DN1282_c0_g1_i1:273-698(+)
MAEIPCNDVQTILEQIRENKSFLVSPTITEIIYDGTWIDLQGARLLSNGLVTNSSITNLSITRNNVRDIGGSLIVEALKCNTALTVLDLSGNAIGNLASKTISDLLNTSSTLRKLYLNCNFSHYFLCFTVGSTIVVQLSVC